MGTIGGIGVPYEEVSMHAGIYAPNYNIGIINENTIIDVSITNNQNMSKIYTINLITYSYLNNYTLFVNASSWNSTQLTEKLFQTGLWIIEVINPEGKRVESYSFNVYGNIDEAKYMMNRFNFSTTSQDNAQSSLSLSLLGVIASYITILLTIFFSTYALIKQSQKETLERNEHLSSLIHDIETETRTRKIQLLDIILKDFKDNKDGFNFINGLNRPYDRINVEGQEKIFKTIAFANRVALYVNMGDIDYDIVAWFIGGSILQICLNSTVAEAVFRRREQFSHAYLDLESFALRLYTESFDTSIIPYKFVGNRSYPIRTCHE